MVKYSSTSVMSSKILVVYNMVTAEDMWSSIQVVNPEIYIIIIIKTKLKIRIKI